MSTELAPQPMSAPVRVACATEDGEALIDKHFGSAEIYALYEQTDAGFTAVGQVVNSTPEERGDGDRRKARSVLELLAEAGVQVVLARRYGPNITRIRRRLVAVVTSALTATEALRQLGRQRTRLETALALPPEQREHIVLPGQDGSGAGEGARIIAVVQGAECLGCALCAEACPVNAIQVDGIPAVVDADVCVGCGTCVQVCYPKAMSLRL